MNPVEQHAISERKKQLSLPRRTRPLTPEECAKLLESFTGEYKARNIAIVAMELFTSFRISEALSPRCGQVYDYDNNRMRKQMLISGDHLKGSGHTTHELVKKQKLALKESQREREEEKVIELTEEEADEFGATVPEHLKDKFASMLGALETKVNRLEGEIVELYNKKKRKRPEPQTVDICDELAKLLEPCCVGRKADEPLFGMKRNAKSKPGPISRRWVNKLIKKACVAAGIDPDRVATHSFRKSHAEAVYAASGNDIIQVQQSLHQQTINVMPYLQRDANKLRETHAKMILISKKTSHVELEVDAAAV